MTTRLHSNPMFDTDEDGESMHVESVREPEPHPCSLGDHDRYIEPMGGVCALCGEGVSVEMLERESDASLADHCGYWAANSREMKGDNPEAALAALRRASLCIHVLRLRHEDDAEQRRILHSDVARLSRLAGRHEANADMPLFPADVVAHVKARLAKGEAPTLLLQHLSSMPPSDVRDEAVKVVKAWRAA